MQFQLLQNGEFVSAAFLSSRRPAVTRADLKSVHIPGRASRSFRAYTKLGGGLWAENFSARQQSQLASGETNKFLSSSRSLSTRATQCCSGKGFRGDRWLARAERKGRN